MALLFHQNMRVFGGGSAARNAAFNGGFTAINAITGPMYVVAGFTEITNNITSVIQLPPLAAAIDPGLTNLIVIEVGVSALGLREHIGIAWDPAYVNVQHAGQVLKNGVTGQWDAHNTPTGGGLPATINRPGGVNLVADSRGPAYIAGTYNGNHYIFMFFHNMYGTGDRSSAYTNLPAMVRSVRNTIGGAYAAAEAFIGGDYNINPRSPVRKRARDGTITYEPLVACAQQVMGVYTNTTNSNPYDFWLCSDHAFTNANDTVYAQTRFSPNGSDHAAVVLDNV